MILLVTGLHIPRAATKPAATKRKEMVLGHMALQSLSVTFPLATRPTTDVLSYSQHLILSAKSLWRHIRLIQYNMVGIRRHLLSI